MAGVEVGGEEGGEHCFGWVCRRGGGEGGVEVGGSGFDPGGEIMGTDFWVVRVAGLVGWTYWVRWCG